MFLIDTFFFYIPLFLSMQSKIEELECRLKEYESELENLVKTVEEQSSEIEKLKNEMEEKNNRKKNLEAECANSAELYHLEDEINYLFYTINLKKNSKERDEDRILTLHALIDSKNKDLQEELYKLHIYIT